MSIRARSVWQCQCCGIRCELSKKRSDEVICSLASALERGKDVNAVITTHGGDMADTLEIEKKHPILCVECRSHGLCDLRRQAVQRMRMKKRSAETQEASAVKTRRKAASNNMGARLQDHVADNHIEPPE